MRLSVLGYSEQQLPFTDVRFRNPMPKCYCPRAGATIALGNFLALGLVVPTVPLGLFFFDPGEGNLDMTLMMRPPP